MQLARARVEGKEGVWLVRLAASAVVLLARESGHVAADVVREALDGGLDLAGSGLGVAPASRAVLLAPLRNPSKIVATALNYRSHAQETGQAIPIEPRFFTKFASTIVGNDDVVHVQDGALGNLDYEGELAVIIGRRCRAVDVADAASYVFGYTVANDVSARAQQRLDGQWWRAKGSDGFCPLGPVIVTADEIPRGVSLRIRTVVNGVTRQDGVTSDMIFSVDELIAYVSRFITLEPGDIVLTGTPSGVGAAADPPRFLADGDLVVVEIEKIGSLRSLIAVTTA